MPTSHVMTDPLLPKRSCHDSITICYIRYGESPSRSWMSSYRIVSIADDVKGILSAVHCVGECPMSLTSFILTCLNLHSDVGTLSNTLTQATQQLRPGCSHETRRKSSRCKSGPFCAEPKSYTHDTPFFFEMVLTLQ
jgi:hypothetical protein